MTSPKDVLPHWDHGIADGLVTSACARLTLNGPIADPAEGPNVIFLDINPDDDGFRWSAYYGAEEGAPFNEGEIKWGSATDLEQAKRDSWAEAYRFLISLDYTNGEITGAVSRPAGSLELDLDDGDEDD
jgi:hypothetical protein